MRIYLFFILAFIAGNLFAQKPVIDSTAYAQWPSFGWFIKLSNDGKYVIYNVENKSTGKNIVFLQSTDGKCKKEIVDGSFTADSKFFCYKQGKDSLAMLMPGTDEIKYFADISSFGLQTTKEGECLYYSPVSQPGTLVLMDVKTHRKKIFEDVLSWKFSEDGTVLLLGKSIKNNADQQSLNWVDMAAGKTTKIVEGKKAEIILLDGKHQQCIYKQENTFWYYKINTKPVSLSDRINAVIKDGFSLENINNFSKDGKHLFLSLKGIGKPKPVAGAVEVWSYTDPVLQSEPLEEEFGSYSAVIDLENYKFFRLQEELIEQLSYPTDLDAPDTICLVEKDTRFNEQWSITNNSIRKLISTRTGEVKNLNFLTGNRLVKMSFSGKYLIYFDTKESNYFSYEIATGTIRNITKGIDTDWIDSVWYDAPKLNRYPMGLYLSAWLKNDEAVLICDQYDVWKIDPLNKQKPVNITNGYGKKNNIIFQLGLDAYRNEGVDKNKPVLLNAFNLDNKDNGYFSKRLNKTGDPEKLFMGPYVIDIKNPGYLPEGVNFNPVKAKNADVYLVRRSSATEAPNYFITRDFKTFTRLTDLNPEKKYNWYTTELHSWKSLDGRMLQGILFKPENFDPNKKYPVIFHYYQRKSNGLNAYLKPEELDHYMNINIPTYVSNGYLVFTPDIYYKKGNPMQGTYDAVVSAAKYISGFSFVDAGKMGIQGGSFGGFQTNYLVTHTNLFAAAVSSSGIADLVSGYGSLMDGGNSQQDFYETGQIRMGGSLWEKPEAYIKNSPVFQVNKVTTPLLIMQGKTDGICLYANTVEFFTGLRRMGKRAWMLVYPNAGHGIDGKDKEDFTIRMRQFFDHYLKGSPAPIWMLNGIPPSKRGLDNGYQLDTKGRTPGPGLLKPEEQQKVDALTNK